MTCAYKCFVYAHIRMCVHACAGHVSALDGVVLRVCAAYMCGCVRAHVCACVYVWLCARVRATVFMFYLCICVSVDACVCLCYLCVCTWIHVCAHVVVGVHARVCLCCFCVYAVCVCSACARARYVIRLRCLWAGWLAGCPLAHPSPGYPSPRPLLPLRRLRPFCASWTYLSATWQPTRAALGLGPLLTGSTC